MTTPLGNRTHGLPPQTERDWTGTWATGNPPDGGAAASDSRDMWAVEPAVPTATCPQLISVLNPGEWSRAVNHRAQFRESVLIPTATVQLH